MAGVHFRENNSGARTFRINIPAPGTYEITLAIGDAGSTSNNYWEILDDASSLEINDLTAATTAGDNFLDANEALHTSGPNWVTNNTPKQYTFASSIVNIRFGKGSGGGATGTAAIGIRQVSAGGSKVPLFVQQHQ